MAPARAGWRLFRRRRRVVALPSTERQFDCLSLPDMRLPPFGARNAPKKPSETGNMVGAGFCSMTTQSSPARSQCGQQPCEDQHKVVLVRKIEERPQDFD